MKSKKDLLNIHNQSEKYLFAFVLGFLSLFIAILPIMIADKGYFIYYGDYNSQQIPFYTLANNAVREGQFGWNWFTDLGSDFIGSYSFYLLGSPFFWLSTILPKFLVTYSMPFLLCLKHAMATLTAYAFIRKFVRNKNACLIGALLYAFSGFQIFNLFFNHFQDVTAFFPLMLIALEENINNNKKGYFAVIVAFMAVLNYFFFTGQAIFLILYFLMRLGCKDFNITLKKFLMLLFEAIIGTMIASFMLIPSAIIILDNYRVSEYLTGIDMVLYSDKTRIPRIIQSFFMPVDVPARPNLFSSDYAKWASIGGYLPLFSMAGVIAFIGKNKNHWAVKLFSICTICSFIPILNSSFYMFNSSYYARWFYMPILILAMMTAHALDDANSKWSFGIKICGGFLTAFGIISLLPTENDDKTLKWFSLPNDIIYFFITLIIAFGFLAITVFLIKNKSKFYNFMHTALIFTVIACVTCTMLALYYSANSPDYAKKFIDSGIEGQDIVFEEVSDDNFFRVDISENYDNYPMSWGLPSMRAFQSVVSPSIMEFYDNINIQRDVASRADLSHYTLRGLLSVKYYYSGIEKDKDIDLSQELKNFVLVDSTEYFDIYENTLYIPMGIAYDEFITEERAKNIGEINTERTMIKSLIISEELAEKYSNILTETVSTNGLNNNTYIEDCKEKQLSACDSFVYDSYGFEATINLDKPQLIFFSVPYNKGWTAQVNGVDVDVEKVTYGFMAVKAETGDNVITFKYKTLGLYEGIAISIAGLIILLIYLFICKKNKSYSPCHSHYYNYDSTSEIKAISDYQNKLLNSFKEDE